MLFRAVVASLVVAAGCSFSAGGNPADLDAAADGSALALCDPARGALVACWSFDSGFDDAIGLVGASAVTGDPELVAGVDGQAVELDGNDSLGVAADTNFDVTDMTFELWVNATAPTSGRSGLGDLEAHFGVFVHPGGEVRCATNGSATLSSADTGTALIDGEWHHVACRHAPGRGRELFIDGDVVACAATASPLMTDVQPLVIGANSPDSSDALVGAIDSLRFWGEAVSSAALCEAAGRAPGDCQVLAQGCNLP